MTEGRTQEALVEDQFGARAAAYLTSAVHAQGPDLKAIAALLEGKRAARVLDLGCGGGHVSFAVAPHVREVVAYDLSPEMLAVVARAAGERGLANVATRQGYVERLPFEDASFDVVLSRFSAHHWRDFEAGLGEAARVLKPGGLAAFCDTVTPGLPLLDTFFQAIELLRDTSHVRNYSRAEWQAAIARAGLRPGAVRGYPLHLGFASWIERMRTPKLQADAIRALQQAAADAVVRQFAIEPDGSFTMEAVLFEARKPDA